MHTHLAMLFIVLTIIHLLNGEHILLHVTWPRLGGISILLWQTTTLLSG